MKWITLRRPITGIFSYFAADYEKPVTLGYTARQDNQAMKNYTAELKRNIDEGLIDSKALYITTPEFAPRFMHCLSIGEGRCEADRWLCCFLFERIGERCRIFIYF